MLEKKVKDADALLLVTDKPSFEIPSSLKSVQHHFTGNSYVWRPYGINCALIGGSVHSRKVAMRLRVLLEGSDFPYMAGVLPRRCSWTEMYAVDPSLETPGPCVLWKTIGLIFEALCLLKLTCWARHCSCKISRGKQFHNFTSFWLLFYPSQSFRHSVPRKHKMKGPSYSCIAL